MILVDDMLAVAFQYRDTELWKELTDSDVFGISPIRWGNRILLRDGKCR